MQGSGTNETVSAEESCARYRSQIGDVLRWAGVAYWELIVAEGVLHVSTDFLASYGYKPEDLVPITLDRWKQLVHPDDVPHAVASFEHAIAGHMEILDAVYRMRTASGDWRFFRSKGGVAETSPENEVIRLSGTLQDITDLKAADITLSRRDRLLSAVNDIASILLITDFEDFDRTLMHVLSILGTEAEVDRVYIWENEYIDGELYTTQTHEWSPYVEPQQGNELTVKVKSPQIWVESFLQGNCVNNIVKNMTQVEQDQLLPQGIVSILVAPIMFQGGLWGFMGFDDCQRERTWDGTEIGILKSAGMMVASAIQRHKIASDLKRERQILNRTIDTSPVTIVTVTDGKVTQLNKKGQALFAIPIGTRMADVYAKVIGKHQNTLSRDLIFREIREKGVFFRRDIQYVCTDGLIHDFIVTILPFEPDNVRKSISWIIDVTDLKEAERTLILAKDKAEIATRAKSDFLARMSHEIRTPMNAILGMIYLCLQTELSEKQKDYLTKTQSAANNLLGIINDILDFSKVEAGKLELELIPFSLGKTINDVVDTIKTGVDNKGLKLITKIDPDICDSLIGDPLRLRQILLNLTSNAIKFTASGGLFITVRKDSSWFQDNAEKIRIVFEVRDTGIGLKVEQVETIFDSFSQADGSTTRKYGGTGLGLAIVKSFVHLMEGEVNVKSIPGQGAAFSFTAVFTRAKAEPELSSAILLARRRVLIVDDSANDLEVMTNLMQSMHISASAARSGQAALEMLEDASMLSNAFELVIIDWRMPRMDGIETVRQIRQNVKILPPHIVMMSAYDRQECLRQAHGLDVSDVLVKPISPVVLKATLKSIFRENVSGIMNEARADIRGAKVLLAEDNKINQMVASELLTIMQVEVTVANNGIEAVEAVKQHNFDLILMDIQMPEMDGLAATKEIRKLDKPEVKKIPILAMTANAMDADYQKSLDVGMNDHLTKPIEPQKLRLALEKWIVR